MTAQDTPNSFTLLAEKWHAHVLPPRAHVRENWVLRSCPDQLGQTSWSLPQINAGLGAIYINSWKREDLKNSAFKIALGYSACAYLSSHSTAGRKEGKTCRTFWMQPYTTPRGTFILCLQAAVALSWIRSDRLERLQELSANIYSAAGSDSSNLSWMLWQFLAATRELQVMLPQEILKQKSEVKNKKAPRLHNLLHNRK